MKDKKFFLRVTKYVPFLLFLMFSLYLHSDVGLRDWDDYVYRDSWNDMAVVEWIKKFYMNWSGRIPLQMLHIVFLQVPLYVWRIWDSILYTLCVFSVARLALVFGDNSFLKQLITNTVVSVMFILIPHEVLNRVIKWMAGSFNYLLPVVCMFLALYPVAKFLKGDKITQIDYGIAFLATFLCCYAEQTAAIYICMGFLCGIYCIVKRIIVPRIGIGIMIFGLCNAAIEYLAPGNMVRYDSEVILWYNQYDMYSLFDKLLMGITFCIKMLLEYGWIMFVVLFVLLIPKILQCSGIYKGVYIVLIIYTFILRKLLLNVQVNSIFMVTKELNMFIIWSIVFWVMLMSSFLFLTYIDDMETALTISFSYLAAVASGTVVAMSPSCYTSEQRVFFVSYILLIFIIGLQIQGFKKYEQD